MKVEITQQERNDTVKRVQIVANVTDNQATPSRKELQTKLAAKANVKPEVVVVENIKTNFGSSNVIVTAYAYDSMEDLINAEPKYMAEKNKYEEPQPEAAPAEEPAAEEAKEESKDDSEAPAEEKKEEAKE